MKTYLRLIVSFLILVAITGCARFEGSNLGQTQALGSSAANNSVTAIVPSEQFSETAILEFLPSEAVASLSEKDRTEAASAQFFALQYGRVGAFREWSGSGDSSGEVSVGPYIKVNSLDCREFTHTVLLSGIRLSKSGTSCRVEDGQWNVVSG